jgi:hypothetical protein
MFPHPHLRLHRQRAAELEQEAAGRRSVKDARRRRDRGADPDPPRRRATRGGSTAA